MSTLSGQTSKGEKTKQKFQSLDINSLYRVSRGENLEKQQTKSSSSYIRHGMQSLGKVPNARRAPANLPSLKAEHSGTDAAVPLVPPGAPGWGKQDSTTTQPNTPTTQTPSTNSTTPTNANQSPSSQLTSHQAAIALPVTTTIPSHNKQLTPAQPVPTDKLWSSVMSGQDVPHPPLYQSPQFQHEFPSLSAGDGGLTRTGSDAPYPSGLSLRPQTEGSWTQGGQRPAPGEGSVPPRPGSVPLGAPPQLSAQVGLTPQQPFPPQIRGVMPSFMYKGSSFQQGSGIQNQNTPAPVNGRSSRSADNRPPRLADRDMDEVTSRPIIKEEELSRMDEIGKDMGWAESDEIDYNQKLAFSDGESDLKIKKTSRKNQPSKENKEHERSNDIYVNDNQPRQWSNTRASASRGKSSEEEDIWMQKRSQTDKEMEIVVQRAKQRKEEEEKRFNEERKQGAAKKLMELEEKIQKRDRENHENMGTINPNSIPPKPINYVEIPLPEFQKEKEQDRDAPRDRDNRSRTPNDLPDDKIQPPNQASSFRHLTQIEGKNFPRKHQKGADRESRDRDREQNGPTFSRHFQNDIPPRFLKHQQRTNTNSNMQNQQQPYHFDSNRWMTNNQPSSKLQQNSSHVQSHNRNVREDSPERHHEVEEERRDYKRQSSEDSYRSTHRSSQEFSQKTPEVRYEDIQNYESHYSRKEEDKWQKDKERQEERWPKDKDKKDDRPIRQGSDDWTERKDKVRDNKLSNMFERERPQRPDSRDSRSAKHSRDSEPRDYMGSWSEAAYESTYEEKRREHVREDRRAVPGPITKERIEADDMRSEKRNLTQLKRGQRVDIKSEIKKENKEELDNKKDHQVTVTDSPLEEAEGNKFSEDGKGSEAHRTENKQFGEQRKPDKTDDYGKDRNQNRGRQYNQNKGWGSDYHSSRGSGWQKRPSSRGRRGRGPYMGEYRGTDSDTSADDHSADIRDQKGGTRSQWYDARDQKSEVREQKHESRDQKSDLHEQRSPKPVKKFEKDDKNRETKQEKSSIEVKKQDKPEKKDNYVPRGEPSRHGRGGGTFRSGRMGGLSKRIDGYGPPPSKSPFSHHDDRDKKSTEEASSETSASAEDKTKQNQQALAAGIIGKSRAESGHSSDERTKTRNKMDSRRNKPRTKDDGDTNSENSDERDKKDHRKLQGKLSRAPQSSNRSRNIPPPRLGGDKRSCDTGRNENPIRQNSNNSLQKDDKLCDQNVLVNAIADISLKNREEGDQMEEKEDKGSVNGDSEGFQEVKSKKTVKERQRSAEDKQVKNIAKGDPLKDPTKGDRDRKCKSVVTQQLTQQQIQNIPSLMATPVNPPPVLPQPKSQFERPRQSKLAPRFVKQKLQKAQMQQHNMCEVNDLNKVNQNINVYGIKDTVSVPPPVSCAWDKPLGPQLRNMEHDGMLGVSMDAVKTLEQAQSPSQGTSPNEKMMGKPPQIQDKTHLDGTTPPVNTIIFENTNFKSAPGSRNMRNEKPRSKLEEGNMDNSVMSSFNKQTMNELLQSKNDKPDGIQLPLFKEDTSDMKLDFFGSDLQFADDKSSKNLCMTTKSLHAITSGNNTVDSLDIKIASVKKVWETSEQEGEETQISFGGPPLDSNVFSQAKDAPDDNHEGYSPPNQTASTTTNVCKVKPTQQVSGSGQTVLSSTNHQQHSGIVAPGLMGNPLSPPPLPPVLGASVGLGPQQYTASQHIGYQAGLSGSTQFGMSAIPSPPTVPIVYNSTQQLQAAAAQTAGLYGTFQIDQSGVLGGQGRSQYSQYTNYHSLGQTASSPYSTQSVYLQTAPPHPPPTAQAPPELYPNMSNYRLSATTPFGQNQQLNNPTTVLISSTSNSLMSASVKPSSQPISAIGTKAGGVGQAYQQQSQQGQQVYMTYDPSIQANYLPPSAGVMQRAPTGPVQSNVVPGLQPSSSYYSGSAGSQTGYFQQPGNSSMPSAQLQQHQAGYGLQGNVFGTHNQSHTNTGLPSYNSHFLTTSMQMAAAINAQQFRSGLPAPYMKGVGNQIGDQSGRPQQLKSPSSQEVLSSVFNTGPQIPSPKSRQNCKHPPPQSSPTAQHKYNLYQTVGQQNPNVQRYPTPIQRPVNFQQMQQNNSVNQKHRNNSNTKTPNRQYYSGPNNSLSSQGEKVEDSKMNDSVALSSTNSANNTNKTAIGTSSTVTVNVSAEKVKDNIKEETAALKD